MAKKIRVAILFGGKSAEHEVSIQSAKNVIAALDPGKYKTIPIKISKTGKWNRQLRDVEVVFPVLHGPFGEDGTIQGLLKLAGIPFVGAGVLGSALGMDKGAMKRLLNHAGISTARFTTCLKSDFKQVESDFTKIKNRLGLPFFVKPANMGSSVGISKVKNKNDFQKAIKDAFRFDRKILIEEYIRGREIECSVLGNEKPIASLPGEIIPRHEFYSYEAKYIDPEGAELKIPADLPKPVIRKVQTMAIRAFQTLCCEGMARVDFFLKPDGSLVVNELNTIPGFTNISMYPKLWEASGVSYGELIDRLIRLALERHSKEKELETSYLQN